MPVLGVFGFFSVNVDAEDGLRTKKNVGYEYSGGIGSKYSYSKTQENTKIYSENFGNRE